MEPIFEPDDVDLVISSGRWSDAILAEVADFFQHCDDNQSPSCDRDTTSKVRGKSTDVVSSGGNLRKPNHVA